MDSLNAPARTPFIFLALSGVVMIVALTTSRKARGVIKTSVDLARQDAGDEMFGSSGLARVSCVLRRPSLPESTMRCRRD